VIGRGAGRYQQHDDDQMEEDGHTALINGASAGEASEKQEAAREAWRAQILKL
jgi:hypothetical protein